MIRLIKWLICLLAELQELCDAEPLMKRVVEARSGRQEQPSQKQKYLLTNFSFLFHLMWPLTESARYSKDKPANLIVVAQRYVLWWAKIKIWPYRCNNHLAAPRPFLTTLRSLDLQMR